MQVRQETERGGVRGPEGSGRSRVKTWWALHCKYLFLSAHHGLQILVHESELLLQVPHSAAQLVQEVEVGGEGGREEGGSGNGSRDTRQVPNRWCWCVEACITQNTHTENTHNQVSV